MPAGKLKALKTPDSALTRIPVHTSAQLNQTCLLLLGFLLWMLLYPYAGMRHDARLYTLQAQGYMSPELYGHDIFLKFGSQDNYTFFTPLYAGLCQWFGIEHAAALLTALGQGLLLFACWVIARQLSTALWATATACLVLILPGNYGSDFIFTYFETFLTPRLFAEALSLMALLAHWRQRRWLSLILIVAALLLHPIMGMAGVVFLCISHVLPHRKWLIANLLAGLMIIAVLWRLPASSPLKFDAEWLQMVDARAPCLFLKNWLFADMARLATPTLTLLLATSLLTNPLQKHIALCALLTGAAGLAVNAIGADWLEIVVLTQGQAWRWLWLSTLLAVILLIPLLRALWSRGLPGQSTALLLISAWLVRNESFSLGILALTICSAAALLYQLATIHNWKLYRLLAALTLAGTVSWMFAVSSLYGGQLIYTYHWPNWIDAWLTFLANSPLPALLLTGSLWCIYRSHMARRTLTLTLASACLLFVPFSWRNWSYQEYSPAVISAMAPWRALISPGSDVLWMNGSPTPVWMALQRSSYISSIQTTVTLFSRAAAFELKERAARVAPLFPGVDPMRWIGTTESFTPSTLSLATICAQIPVQFIVSSATLDQPPVASSPAALPSNYRTAKLYQCPTLPPVTP